MTLWELGFETPKDHPEPYVRVIEEADFVLAFAMSVMEKGWTLTSVKNLT